MSHRYWIALGAAIVTMFSAVACDPPPRNLTQAQVDALPETPDTCFVYHGPDVFEGCAGTDGLKMDIYHQPPEGEVWPVIVFAHGGGWFKGDRTEIDDEFAHIGAAILHQANRTDVDWTVVSIDYTLNQAWPEPLLDVKRAVRMVQALMAAAGEVQPVIVAGSSAGGHLAAMAALTEGVSGLEPAAGATDIAGAVNLDGPNDLGTLWGASDRATPFPGLTLTPAEQSVFGPTAEFGELLVKLAGCPVAVPYSDAFRPWDDPTCASLVDSLVAHASPIPHAGPGDPPVYLVCGETPGFPASFGCTTDHQTMRDHLLGSGSPPAAGLDQTTGTHYSIDWNLNLPALQSFLDGLR